MNLTTICFDWVTDITYNCSPNQEIWQISVEQKSSSKFKGFLMWIEMKKLQDTTFATLFNLIQDATFATKSNLK